MKRLVLLAVKFYQMALRPILGPSCRFYPSCSHYCIEAVEKHGTVKGCWLTTKRIVKCNPWHPGGYDPVP